MPPRNRNRRRSGRRPNVFVQTEQPSGRAQPAEQDASDATPSIAAAPSPAISASDATQQTARAPRRTQRTRSEVYARTFPREIRKMGILAAGIVVALTVFTLVL